MICDLYTENTSSTFIILLGLVMFMDLVLVAMALFAFWASKKIKQHGVYMLNGIIPAKSWLLGYPKTDTKVEPTNRNRLAARTNIFFSYVFMFVGYFVIGVAIIYSGWVILTNRPI